MARFRKGTTDHDGDKRMGGSLKAGSRFVAGTNDADNDGRKGGSLPKGDEPMAKKPAKPAVKDKPAPAEVKKAARKPVELKPVPVDAKLAPRASRRAALVAEQERLAAANPAAEPEADESVGHHPGGMEPPVSPEAAQAALEAQFAAADMVGDPRVDEQAAILGVRGF